MFYAAWGVPDSIAGRFEVIVIHLCVVLACLEAEGQSGAALARALNEAFIADLDASMREMTFGDLAVPRQIKLSAAALFDRHSAYRRALASGEHAALTQTLATQMAYLAGAGGVDAARLAHYMLEAADGLRRQPASALWAGRLMWPVLEGPTLGRPTSEAPMPDRQRPRSDGPTSERPRPPGGSAGGGGSR